MSDYSDAIDAAEKALKLYAALKDEGGMASCYNNLSLTYIALKDFRNAYHYARPSHCQAHALVTTTLQEDQPSASTKLE